MGHKSAEWVLQWWQTNQAEYPCMARAARLPQCLRPSGEEPARHTTQIAAHYGGLNCFRVHFSQVLSAHLPSAQWISSKCPGHSSLKCSVHFFKCSAHISQVPNAQLPQIFTTHTSQVLKARVFFSLVKFTIFMHIMPKSSLTIRLTLGHKMLCTISLTFYYTTLSGPASLAAYFVANYSLL